jgi:hypothetical protein
MNKKVSVAIMRGMTHTVVRVFRQDKIRWYHPSRNSIQRIVKCLTGLVKVHADEDYVMVEKYL